MIYIISTWSGKVGMTAAELVEFCDVPDHRDMWFTVESAESEEEHACGDEAETPYTRTGKPYVHSADEVWPIDLAEWGLT